MEQPCAPKGVFFAWEIWWGKVLTMEQLRKRGFQMASRCLCGRTKENLDHLLLHCHLIWSLFGGGGGGGGGGLPSQA